MKNLRRRTDGRLYWHWDPKFFSRDEGVEPPCAVTLRGHVPQLEVFDIDGAGHTVVGDRNDVFNQGILEFLQRHLPAADSFAQAPIPSL